MKQILLAINFNFNYYQQIPVLKKFYEPHFGKVVFCGYDKSSNYSEDELLKMTGTKGYEGYQCLALAIEKYPNYKGYFHSNDDVLLNFWNLNFDIDRVWLGAPAHLTYVRGKRPFPKWVWWPTSGPRCERVFQKLNSMVAEETKFTEFTVSNAPDTRLPIQRNELKKLLQVYYKNSGMKKYV